MADKRPVNRVTPKRRTSGTPQDSSSRRALGREGQAGSARRTSADADHPRASTANTGTDPKNGATQAGAGAATAGAAKAETTKAGAAKAGTARAGAAKAGAAKDVGTTSGAGESGAATTGRAKTGLAKTGLAKAGSTKPRVTATSAPGRSASHGAGAASRGVDVASGVDGHSPVPGGSWRLAIGCGIAAVLLGVFAVVAALRPGVDDDNLAYVDNQATDEVKAAADHALSTLYGYRAAEIDQWKDSVGAVLTERMRADLEKYIDTTVSTIKQAATDTEVTTDPIGVTLLTPGRAELLVNLNVSAVRDGTPEPLASGPVVLRMQKVDGRWLAAEIADN